MQLAIHELDRTNYVVAAPQQTWLLSFFEVGTKVDISLAHVEDYSPVLETFCLECEVWGTTLWSGVPLENLANDIAQVIYHSIEVGFPLELALNYGGRILGETVPIYHVGVRH